MNGNNMTYNLTVDSAGTIVNINQILQVVEKAQYSIEELDRLNNLYLNVTTNNYANKEELTNALAKKVTEFNLKKQQELGEQNLLDVLKESNASIRNQIRVITTSSAENLNGRVQTYVEYIDPDTKEVFRIHCDDPNRINNFIEAHSSEIGDWSAKQIFEYFSKYINVTIEKYDTEKFFKNAEQMNRTGLNNPEDFNYQRKLIEEYARRIDPNADLDKVQVVTDDVTSINPESDELMWTTDGKNLLKFVNEGGSMKLIELSDGVSHEKEEEKEEMQSGIGEDQNHEVLQEYDPSRRYEVERQEINTSNESYDANIFDQLLQKRATYGTQFETILEDVTMLYTQATLAFDKLKQVINSGNIDEELYNAIQSFMEPILYQANVFGEDSLNPNDRNFLEQYGPLNEQYQQKYQQDLQAKRELGIAPRQLYLTNKHDKNQRKAGLINIIILIEAVLLTAIIISLIALINS